MREILFLAYTLLSQIGQKLDSTLVLKLTTLKNRVIVWFQKISIPTSWMVIGNSKGVERKLNCNFHRGA